MKKLVLTSALLALGIGAGLVSNASAGIIGADFTESLDYPVGSLGPRTLQNLGVSLPSTPPQLTAANQISNPTPFAGALNVAFDPVTNILSLTGDSSNIYQTAVVTLSNIVFGTSEVITGITPISTGNAVSDAGYNFSITPSFGSNFFSVYYVAGQVLSGGYFNIGTQTDTFQITLSAVSAVPEPATLTLMSIGLAGFGFSRCRSKSA